jgi:hypothetical protein
VRVIGSDASRVNWLREHIELQFNYLLNKGIANDAQRCALKHLKTKKRKLWSRIKVLKKILTGCDYENAEATWAALPIWGPGC